MTELLHTQPIDWLSLWQSYEYIGPGHNFKPVHRENQGGPDDQPYIWASDADWTIDTPENPHSILPILMYCYWSYDAPSDFRNAKISFHLRGDHLDLHGAECYFWVASATPAVTRWHFVDHPIMISHGTWDSFTELTLSNDPELWHRSFSKDAANPMSLNQTLAACSSYGFSFVGFNEKVTGRLALGSFTITPAKSSPWPYSAGRSKSDLWLTVSRENKSQVQVQENEFTRTYKTNNPFLGDTISVFDDFILIPNDLPFSYFLFLHVDSCTKGHDLRNALIILNPVCYNLDLQGGSFHFFIENTKTNTRWIYHEINPTTPNIWTLKDDESLWSRISGNAPFSEIVAGDKGALGHDYIGFMTVNCKTQPSGFWGIEHFSIGPQING